MTTLSSRGKLLSDAFQNNLRIYQRGPVAGVRKREVIMGITATGTFRDGMTVDMYLAKAGTILASSSRVYRWQDTLCFEVNEDTEQRLIVLASQQKAEPNAVSLLSNLMCAGVQGSENSTQSLLPSNLVNALLLDQDLWRRLPVIKSYTRRPIFDEKFTLCGPGWNSDQGILVHGPDIDPVLDPVSASPDAKPIDRLPSLLRRLFSGFCWSSDADLTNAVGLLLTGFLANHFVENPKPIAIIDGNQKGLGKTLLIQVMGHLLDDAEPPRIPLVRDDELEKKLCAQLREARSSIFFFDNVRTRVESALIEGNALSPVLSFRILGQSGNISRPNDLLWVITSNQASGTEDLISRGLPIRLQYEGDPRQRTFDDNLLEFVRKNRLSLLGELAGMVLRWRQAGMPKGNQKHRCVRWAEVIGGILKTAGFDDFLGNVAEAEAAMDEGLIALTSLAEHVVERNLPSFFSKANENPAQKGKTAGEWIPIFNDAEVARDQLATKSPKGRATWVGTFLGAKIGRSVAITTSTGIGTATLRSQEERARRKIFWFDTQTEGATDLESRKTIPPSSPSPSTTPTPTRRTPKTSPIDPNRVASPPEGLPPASGERVGDGLNWM